MKNVKKILLTITAILGVSITYITHTAPTFELYNKADKAIGVIIQESGWPHKEKHIVQSKQQLPLNINIARVLYISIFDNTNTIEELKSKNDNQAHVFRINCLGKRTAYLTWNPGKIPYLYPQTGPWLGFLGKTESGLPLDKKTNIMHNQIQNTQNPSQNAVVSNNNESINQECCICMEETNLMPIPCKHKHNERICKSCLNAIMQKNAECPMCREKLMQ